MTTIFKIREAALPRDRGPLLAIIDEYLAWLDMDLSHRGFDAEMVEFDRHFTLPSGLFLLAETGEQLAGCVGLLRHPGSRAEIKRLFVRPRYRGHALGEELIRTLIRRARELGFAQLILDVVPRTCFAIGLYERMGFRDGDPFYDDAVPGTRFLEMALTVPP